MPRKPFLLPSLALLSCCQYTVAADVGGRDSAGFLRGDYLVRLERDRRRLSAEPNLPDCPGTTMDLYYDANITLEQSIDDEFECSDDDMVYAGMELEQIVKELEQIYPDFSNEWLNTKICAIPEVEVTEEEYEEEVTETTGEPETTREPETTTREHETQHSDEPETTIEPEINGEAETTEQPTGEAETTIEPETTAGPETTELPSGLPETTVEPETTDEPEITEEPSGEPKTIEEPKTTTQRSDEPETTDEPVSKSDSPTEPDQTVDDGLVDAPTTLSPKKDDSEGTALTIKVNGNEGLPLWLVGPANRYLKRSKDPTLTVDVLSGPTLMPTPETDHRYLAVPKKRVWRRNRFVFRSSGLCRRCRPDNKDHRRRRRISEIDEEQAAENAEEVCNYASTAKLAAKIAQSGATNCGKIASEVEGLAEEYNDTKVANHFLGEVQVLLTGCREQEEIASDAARHPPDWCDLAIAASKESEMLDKTQEYRDRAEQSSSDAVAAAKNVQDINQEMMNKKIGLKQLVLTQNFDAQRGQLDAILEKEEETNAVLTAEMDEQIALFEEQLKLARDNVTIAQLEERRGILEQMKVERDDKFEEMQLEFRRMKDTYQDQLEFQIKEANLLLQMEGAETVSEWLQGFSTLIEHRAPRMILERFGVESENAQGCFSSEPNITVAIVEKASTATTYNTSSGECLLPWDAA